jgi:serine/threonine protein phosphatase 1
MNAFIIGDIHGCFHTLEKMLTHWEPRDQKLVFVGDYIDRGNYSGKVLKLLWELQKSHPETVLLKGNHEYIYKFHYTREPQTDWAREGAGKPTIKDFALENIKSAMAIDFFDSLSLEYDAPGYKISHAGIANTETDVYNEDNYDYGILWTRRELKNIGKPQIIGHTPHELQAPLIDTISNSYNIDSGCCYGRGLTGIVMNYNGELLETFFEKVDDRDIC